MTDEMILKLVHEESWKIAQIVMYLMGIQTTIFLAMLGGIWSSMSTMKQEMKEIRRDIANIDKEVAVITATMRFNGFDLDRHKAEGE